MFFLKATASLSTKSPPSTTHLPRQPLSTLRRRQLFNLEFVVTTQRNAYVLTLPTAFSHGSMGFLLGMQKPQISAGCFFITQLCFKFMMKIQYTYRISQHLFTWMVSFFGGMQNPKPRLQDVFLLGNTWRSWEWYRKIENPEWFIYASWSCLIWTCLPMVSLYISYIYI